MTSAADQFSGEKAPAEGSSSRAGRKHHRLRVNLKQWAIIHAVIDYGSFANAAEHLNLSQSAISYSVAKMQEQLGVCILQIEGRKAQLTEHGVRLLKYSRQLLRAAADLESYAMNLQRQVTNLKIAVDEYFPTPLLMDGIRLFSHQNSNVVIDLTEASEQEIELLLEDEAIDLAICSSVPANFHGRPLLDVEYLPVAHPDHPLFRLNREISPADLESETEVVLAKPGRTPVLHEHEGIHAARLWHVKNYDTAISALCEQLGYAWLPRQRIERALKRDKLKLLPLAGNPSYRKMMFAVCSHSVMKVEEIERLLNVIENLMPRPQSWPLYVPSFQTIRAA